MKWMRSTIFWTWHAHCTHELIASLCATYTRLDTSSFHYGREIEFMRCHLAKELLTINAWWTMEFFFNGAATGELTNLQDITPAPMLMWATLSKHTSHKKNPKIHNPGGGLVEDRQGFHMSGREKRQCEVKMTRIHYPFKRLPKNTKEQERNYIFKH